MSPGSQFTLSGFGLGKSATYFTSLSSADIVTLSSDVAENVTLHGLKGRASLMLNRIPAIH